LTKALLLVLCALNPRCPLADGTPFAEYPEARTFRTGHPWRMPFLATFPALPADASHPKVSR